MMEHVLEEIAELTDAVLALRNPGDGAKLILRGHTQWESGSQEAADIAIPIPSDWDFEVASFGVYLSAKVVDQNGLTGSTSDLTFRPARWVSTCFQATNNSAPDYEVGDANVSLTISDTHNGFWNKEGAPIDVAAVYSSMYGRGPLANAYPLTAWCGPRTLHCPQTVRRGGTININVQPTFSRTSNTSLRTVFRATALFLGERVIRGAM